MRSQEEILRKIQDLERTESDPTRTVQRALVRKLELKYARQYLNPARIIDIEQWKTTSRVDRDFVMHELHEKMWDAFEHIIEFDFKRCLVMVQMMMIDIWLIEDDILLREVIRRFTSPPVHGHGKLKKHFKGIYILICEHLGWPVKNFIRDWEDPDVTEGGIILSGG